MGLGSATVVSLKDAREKADEHRTQTAKKVDPIIKREQEAAAARATLAASVAKAKTFAQYADEYIAGHEVVWKSSIHRLQWRSTMRDYVNPVLGDMPLCEIDTIAVMKVLQPTQL